MLDTPVIDLYIAVRHFCRCRGTGEWWGVFELEVANIKGGDGANQSCLKLRCEDSDSNVCFKSCSPRMGGNWAVTVTLKIMREPIKVNVRMAGLHVHREAVAVFF